MVMYKCVLASSFENVKLVWILLLRIYGAMNVTSLPLDQCAACLAWFCHRRDSMVLEGGGVVITELGNPPTDSATYVVSLPLIIGHPQLH